MATTHIGVQIKGQMTSVRADQGVAKFLKSQADKQGNITLTRNNYAEFADVTVNDGKGWGKTEIPFLAVVGKACDDRANVPIRISGKTYNVEVSDWAEKKVKQQAEANFFSLAKLASGRSSYYARVNVNVSGNKVKCTFPTDVLATLEQVSKNKISMADTKKLAKVMFDGKLTIPEANAAETLAWAMDGRRKVTVTDSKGHEMRLRFTNNAAEDAFVGMMYNYLVK